MKGIIVVDKPSGMTSFDVVKIVRRKLKIKKAGHCGTLDPLATGLLVILLGESTKLFSRFSSFNKAYEVTLELGVSTSTGDCEGDVLSRNKVSGISFSDTENVLKIFVGEIMQLPPMYSALKYQGRKLYEFARLGIEVPRKERLINIYELKILNFNLPYVDFYVHCSKGTYIRSLATDIGDKFGFGACVTKLRRVGLGPFSIGESIGLDELNESHIRNWPN